MKINYLRAKNFLSIGEIEIDFTKYGNIINIKGENRDHGPGASNGAGKSNFISFSLTNVRNSCATDEPLY